MKNDFLYFIYCDHRQYGAFITVSRINTSREFLASGIRNRRGKNNNIAINLRSFGGKGVGLEGVDYVVANIGLIYA